LGYFAEFEGIGERSNDMLLSDDLGEFLRTILAVESGGRHGGELLAY
jgi:hypothetical protein